MFKFLYGLNVSFDIFFTLNLLQYVILHSSVGILQKFVV